MSNAVPVRLRQVRDLGQVISDSLLFIRQNRMLLYKSLAFGCIPLLVLGSFFLMSFFRDAMGPALRMEQATPSFADMFLGYLCIGLAFLLSVSIIQEHVRAYLHQEHHTLSAGELIKRAVVQVPMYLGLGVAVYAIVLVGLILLVVPGIWAAIALSLVFTCHGIERNGFGAIGRSFRLVQGSWWNTFGTLFLQGLLMGVIGYAIMIPMFFLLGFADFNTADPEAAGLRMMNTMPLLMSLMMVVYLFLYPFPIIGTVLIYFSEVEKKEQRGLGDRINEFDTL